MANTTKHAQEFDLLDLPEGDGKSNAFRTQLAACAANYEQLMDMSIGASRLNGWLSDGTDFNNAAVISHDEIVKHRDSQSAPILQMKVRGI